MTGNEFKAARLLRLKCKQTELARMMKTPRRTVQEIEAQGDKQIKGVYEVCMCLLIKHGEVVVADIMENIRADIDSKFPAGIVSEPAAEDRE